MKILVGYIGNCTNNGVDVYLLNFLKELGKEHQIDFLATEIFDTAQEKVIEYNSKIIEIPRLRNPIKRYKNVKKVIDEGKYDIVYSNISEAYNCIEYIAARKLKVKKIILHAHSSGTNSYNVIVRIVNTLINCFAKKFIIKKADKYLACSKKAR